jgi:hypothetical protein
MDLITELGGALFEEDADFYSDKKQTEKIKPETENIYGRLIYLLHDLEIKLPNFVLSKIPYNEELAKPRVDWAPLLENAYKKGRSYGKGDVTELRYLLHKSLSDEYETYDSQSRFMAFLNSFTHGLFDTNTEKPVNEVELSEIEKFDSGFGLIDSVVKGFYQGIWTFAGTPGSGKTSILLSMAASFAKHYPVWYYQTEIPAPIIESRLSQLKPTEWNKNSVLHAGNYNTASILEKCLSYPNKDRVVIYDSPEIKDTGLDDLQYWEKTYQELVQVKSVSKLVIVTSQIKQGLSWDDLGVYSLSGSASKARYSDGIIYLNSFAENLMMKCAKNRFGVPLSRIGKYNFETMQAEQSDEGIDSLWD